MLAVNVLLQYKKRFATVLISTLFLKLLNVFNLSFFQANYYIILFQYLQHCFDIKMWHNLIHGHDCPWYLCT
jgi:hypothetical protein